MEKKEYSNPYRSLEAIWAVLRAHSSKTHPLSVREIWEHLQRMQDAPSRATVERLLPRERALGTALFGGMVLSADSPEAIGAYLSEGVLHVVVETPEGQILDPDAQLEYTAEPFRAPAYSAVDKLLKNGIPFDLGTFPVHLRCVAKRPGRSGKPRYVDYDRWLEDAGPRNNAARYYYTENLLTRSEWNIFSDLVQVYPYITEQQTKRFQGVLNALGARPRGAAPSRYAYKRGSRQMFKIIGLLDKAIRARRRVRLSYGEYRLVKPDAQTPWQPRLLPRERNGELEVEPYALMWSNGNYYLVCRHRDMMNLRVDRILAAEALEERFQASADFDPALYRDRCPVMYPGKPRFVRLRCRTAMLNVLVDFFGAVPQYAQPAEDGTVEVTMSIAPNGVKLFALQYADGVEVLEPAELREEIRAALGRAAEKYAEG